MPAVDWSDFEVELSVLEGRYDYSFPLWDRAGAFWSEVRSRIKDLTLLQAEPSRTVFRKGRSLELQAELSASRLILNQPEKADLEDLEATAASYFGAVRDVLSVDEYTRIGFRTVFRQEFASIEAASSHLLDSGVLRVPTIGPCVANGKARLPEVAMRWDGTHTSISVRMKVDERTSELNVPNAPGIKKLIEVKQEKATTIVLLLDFDYYTNDKVGAAQWEPGEWLRQARHLVRRDGLEWLRGGPR